MSRIIAVANQKGGVGKSATAVNLGYSLSQLGRNVLVVDMDPQQHVNLGFGINPKSIKSSTYDLMMDPKRNPSDSILSYSENLSILPSHLDLALAESELLGKVASDRRLFSQLSKIRDQFDFVIIDSPPSLGILTINSLIASEEVIIAIAPEYLAMQGVVRLVKLLQEIVYAHQKEISYYSLVTIYDGRTNLAREVYQELQEKFQMLCLKTVINNNVKIKEAMSQGLPVGAYDTQCKGAKDYAALAREVDSRDVSEMKGHQVSWV